MKRSAVRTTVSYALGNHSRGCILGATVLEEIQLSSLLSALYDAASDPNLWSVFLERLVKNSGSHAADLVIHDLGQRFHTVSNSWGIDPEGVKLYNEHYYRMDPWVAGGSTKPMNWTGTSEELSDTNVLSHSEFYNDFLLPNLNIRHAMFGVIEKGKSRIANISVFRAPSARRFEPAELELLQFLVPHLRRAFHIHAEITGLRKLNSSIQTALDMVSTAIIVLGAGGDIVVMNHPAAQLLAANDGLLATRFGLRAERRSESAGLEILLAQAIATSCNAGLAPAGTQIVSRRTKPPLHVLITPIRNLPLNGERFSGAFAVITDPLAETRLPQEILRGLFGLTPAESRVALLLADGRSPKEIAATVGVCLSTVKSQIASIYSKTATCRQSQIARLLGRLSVVVSDDCTS